MAINWMDNFNVYGTDGGNTARLLNGVYAQNDGCTLGADPDPTATGLVLNVTPGYGGGQSYQKLRKVLPVARTTLGQALRMWLDALPSEGDMAPCPFSFKDGSNNFLFNVVVTTTGQLSFRQGGFYGTELGITPNPVVTANAWAHMECKLVEDPAVGSFELRIEGVTVLKLTNINTGNTPIAQVELCNDPTSISTGVNMRIKDWIIWDNTGTFNNDFMGSCQVLKIIPNGDISLNWTPSAGTTGFNLINEVTPDDDGSYISAPYPAPAAYVCSLSDLPITVTSVRGVMPIHRSRKTDGGDGNIQIGALSGASTGLGANRPITTAYTYWWDIFDADPNGAVAWSRVSVNALNLQINRTL